MNINLSSPTASEDLLTGGMGAEAGAYPGQIGPILTQPPLPPSDTPEEEDPDRTQTPPPARTPAASVAAAALVPAPAKSKEVGTSDQRPKGADKGTAAVGARVTRKTSTAAGGAG